MTTRMTKTGPDAWTCNGFAVVRAVTGHAYPRNGNVHNPTPEYTYTVTAADGSRVGYAETLGACRRLIAIAVGEAAEAAKTPEAGR